MRAAVLTAPGRMEIREVPNLARGPRDVLVSVEAVGVCGTDFHIFSGEANYNFDTDGRPIPLEREPQILGHEITGRIEAVGIEVPDLHLGDRVVVDQGLNCRSAARRPLCEYCRTGDSHQCDHYRELGITGLPGGFAESVVVPAVNAVKIDANLDPAVAALTEPLACVLHTTEVAALARARYRLDGRRGEETPRSVLVLGAGPAGLLFVQVLRRILRYDGLLLLADPAPHKRALAERLGATVVDPTDVDLGAAVLEHTRGRRIEYLVEATGSGPLFARLPEFVRKQATLILYGYGHAGASLEVLNALQWREPVVVMTTGASGGFDADGRPSVYRRALRSIEEGVIDAASLVTHRYRELAAVPQALAEAGRGPGYVKGVVTL